MQRSKLRYNANMVSGSQPTGHGVLLVPLSRDALPGDAIDDVVPVGDEEVVSGLRSVVGPVRLGPKPRRLPLYNDEDVKSPTGTMVGRTMNMTTPGQIDETVDGSSSPSLLPRTSSYRAHTPKVQRSAVVVTVRGFSDLVVLPSLRLVLWTVIHAP